MADYRFVTTWKLRAPLEAVWEAIAQSERWPQWWRGVVSVRELRAGDADGIGAQQRFVWKSKLPYTLAFDMETIRVERPHRIEGGPAASSKAREFGTSPRQVA